MEADKSSTEDVVLRDNPESVPKSASSTDVEVTADSLSLFIDGQTQPLISDDYFKKVLSPISKGEFNRLVKLMEEINMLTEGISMIFELEIPRVEL